MIFAQPLVVSLLFALFNQELYPIPFLSIPFRNKRRRRRRRRVEEKSRRRATPRHATIAIKKMKEDEPLISASATPPPPPPAHAPSHRSPPRCIKLVASFTRSSIFARPTITVYTVTCIHRLWLLPSISHYELTVGVVTTHTTISIVCKSQKQAKSRPKGQLINIILRLAVAREE